VTKRNLYIVGAGAFGREIESCLDRVPEAARAWSIAGFLDDTPTSLEGYPSDYRVVGSILEFAFAPNDLAIMAIAEPGGKRKVFEAMRKRVEFLTFIAPDAIIGKFTTIGAGSFLGDRVVIGPNVTIGEAVALNTGTLVGHDVTFGSFSSVMANSNVAGRCRIGAEAYLGSSVTIIPKRTICDGAFIGAGSVVVRDVKERGTTVFGNPAKYLR
jgi:sugar O-acyltransferase (sialic acid O-acetyltransferase NeuD family)